MTRPCEHSEDFASLPKCKHEGLLQIYSSHSANLRRCVLLSICKIIDIIVINISLCGGQAATCVLETTNM